jgi:hypothetical protein
MSIKRWLLIWKNRFLFSISTGQFREGRKLALVIFSTEVGTQIWLSTSQLENASGSSCGVAILVQKQRFPADKGTPAFGRPDEHLWKSIHVSESGTVEDLCPVTSIPEI